MLQTHSAILPATDWRRLLENAYRGRALQPYSSGQPIPMGSSDVLIVCRGVVQLSTLSPNGDEAMLGLVLPSMPFGLPFTHLRPYSATALVDVDVMRLNWVEIEQSPFLAQGLFRQLGRRLQQTEAILAMAGQRRIEDRLRQLLLLLAQEMGQSQHEGMRITVRLTHQQLANMIGTTRVTITRLIGQLRDEGWLSIDRQRHLVVNSTASQPI